MVVKLFLEVPKEPEKSLKNEAGIYKSQVRPPNKTGVRGNRQQRAGVG